jgi:regulator of sirC expression with transglutaminase-like and TPR domain
MTDQPRAALRASLDEASPRAVVIRMLNNLKALYLRQQNWAAAWPVQHRLAALQPADYRERRDFAVISMNANRPGQAIELFESCMRTCPTNEKPQLKRQLAEAYSRQSLLN